jgi:anti-sigma regulatory factor (Ser/Thr protein kinase)
MFGMGLMNHREYMDEVRAIREESRNMIMKEITEKGPLQPCCPVK